MATDFIAAIAQIVTVLATFVVALFLDGLPV